ncbi:MAG: hypothetical protein FWG41_03810 [Methanomassiliicoccaceae archaeon]|nr:hypothetical protein [Methanomassiliicoccaceae archaeon]
MVKEVVTKVYDTDGGMCSVVRLYRCERCGRDYEGYTAAMHCEESHGRRRGPGPTHPFDPLAPKYL